MASPNRELLGKPYDDEHLRDLGLRVVTESRQTLGDEDPRGEIFRLEDRDEPSGYLVTSTETTGGQTTLCYLQAAS